MDELDRSIIRILQRDARLPFTKIAEELGQADTTIHFRTRRMVRNGVITRFSALVNPHAMGYDVAGLVKIQVGGHILPEISHDRTRSFAEELASEDQFQWVAVSTEPMTIYALLLGADVSDLNRRADEIRKRPDVVNVNLTIIDSVVKGWEVTGSSSEGV
ncbi:MAG: Lrp/AsnC family transcriptional regulator [Candidatus Thorarchaeota archaeon]